MSSRVGEAKHWDLCRHDLKDHARKLGTPSESLMSIAQKFDASFLTFFASLHET